MASTMAQGVGSVAVGMQICTQQISPMTTGAPGTSTVCTVATSVWMFWQKAAASATVAVGMMARGWSADDAPRMLATFDRLRLALPSFVRAGLYLCFPISRFADITTLFAWRSGFPIFFATAGGGPEPCAHEASDPIRQAIDDISAPDGQPAPSG